ncbi:MAG: hypothetical protein WBG37_04325 [Desulfobacterales bacterium]
MTAGGSFKPAVAKSVLLLLAGVAWFAVGSLLLSYVWAWLPELALKAASIYGSIGVASALAVHHFGFLKVADKNIARIRPMVERKCLFGFITWKSYLLILVMVSLGSLLRHSTIPRHYLVSLYTTIGLALILSSLRYIRVFIHEMRNS